MIQSHLLARCVRTLLVPVAILTTHLAAGLATATDLPDPPRHGKAARIVQARVSAHDTRLTLAPPLASPGRVDSAAPERTGPATRSLLVALPRGTTSYRLQADGAPGVQVRAPEGLMSLRGQPVLRVLTSGTESRPVDLTITHNGDWSAPTTRLASTALNASLGGTLPAGMAAGTTRNGSYLILHAPIFAAAVAPLAEWKTRKGYDVVTVSTSVTGASTEGIKAYLQNAYDTWDVPPEYVLLVGDVNEIPTYSFYGNPSDQLYVQLDGDDWLMDAMIGRLPVENENEAQALINKTINYERHPALATDPNWQTRALMVAGVYASDTPGYTVDFCGEQLQEMGFPAPTTVTSPPLPSLQGASVVRSTINDGVGFVVYRGWAYGTAGWDPPTFTVDDIPALETNDMTPIVMSFVCLNGDYTASTPCFGETFVRQGSGADPGKGAVAFIGNGEHWSHTRYNDAMAISVFERIVAEDITDLGTLLNAGKLRFMDYFPNEISAAEFGEESVEFYFHIYNLMGDPSLKFWRQLPTAITVAHETNLPSGANLLPVSVTTTAGAQPVEGARVGVVQNGVLIGHGFTASDGTVDLALTPVVTGANVLVTVSEAGVSPYEGSIGTGTAGAFLAATDVSVDDGAGNGDQVVNPGETLALTATVHNHGSGPSGAFDLSIVDVDGPASGVPGQVAFAALAGGADAEAAAPLGLVVAADAADGARIQLQWDAVQVGVNHDVSTLDLTVAAPAWDEVSLAPIDGGDPQPGRTTALALTVRNTGSIATAGGTASLNLLNPTGADLGPATATIPPCAPGQTVTTDAAFDLSIDAATATATNLTFALGITTTEGYRTDTHCAVVVGPVDISAPVGPDAHGYYAYDSADFDYPASRPVYAWHEISSALGGPGTKLDFPIENEVVWMIVDLPFSFQYYGQDYSQIRVSDNGWISFDTGVDYDFYNWTIPTQYGVEALVAPFWDNLNPVPPGAGEENVNGIDPDGIYTYHDTAADAFVIEWSRLPHYKPEILGLQTFQVALLNTVSRPTLSGDGELLFSYRQVNNNDYLRMYATVGIESPDGTDGLQLSYGNVNAPGMAPLQPGLAVRVTTAAPVRVPFTLSLLNATTDGGRLELNWAPADGRPVTGWHVDRLRAGRRERLTATPLPGDRRSYAAPLADQTDGDTYILTALHPYGVISEPGRTTAGGTGVTRLALYPAHPNPAPGTTTIGFALPRQTRARLRVYDVAGRLVRTLIDGRTTAGEGVKIWDGRDDDGGPVAGGMYFYRLETNDRTLTRKMILVR